MHCTGAEEQREGGRKGGKEEGRDGRREGGHVPFENGPVVLLLQCRELYVNDSFLLGRDVRRHVLLRPPQQVRLQPLLQLLDLFHRFDLAVTLVEFLHVREFCRFDVVKQGPEFLSVVLQGGARHEDTVLVPVLLEAGLRDDLEAFVELAPPISKPMRFVDDDAAPRDLRDFLWRGEGEGEKEGGREM